MPSSFMARIMRSIFLLSLALYTPIAIIELRGAPEVVRKDTNLKIPMRDGVMLAADLYRPTGPGPFPVLLSRTPYNKSRVAEQAEQFVGHGYAVVAVDSRGLNASEGEWSPYVDEAKDGYDTQVWVANQPWCNGKIGMFGSSYPGFTQLLPARFRHPSVKALIPIAAQSDNFGSIWYTDGLYHLALGLRWGANQAAIARGEKRPEINWTEVVNHLPLQTALDSIEMKSKFVADTLKHSSYDKFWQKMSIRNDYPEMDVPAFHITGWYDDLVHETIRNFTGMRKASRSNNARRWQRLLIGPWGHGIGQNSQYGDVDFGEQAILDPIKIQTEWFDYHLKNKNNLENYSPVRIFVMGKNEWRNESEWPLSRAQPTRLFLRSANGANTRFGDGRLDKQPPVNERPDTYRYDPRNPVKTHGGHGCCGGGLTPHGPLDQQLTQERQDVLVYTSEPLKHDTEVTGTIRVRLFFSTNVSDTDFFATVSDVNPDGRAILITEGVIRTRFRKSLTTPNFVKPGDIHEINIDSWETSNTFKAGHQIRLHITSSNFPRFNRNLNTELPLGQGTYQDIRVAHQTIYHNQSYPSSILLPVIP